MRLFNQKFSLKSEADLLNKLSLYLSADLSLSESLQIMENQAESRRVRGTFAAWRRQIENGKTLVQAFGDENGMAVSGISVHAVNLGERSAALAGSLKEASVQIKKLLDIKKKIAGALAYPAVILVGTVGLVLGLLLFVFPRIVPLFESLNVRLPLSTRILIGLSEMLSEHWLAIIAGIIGLGLLAALLAKFSQKYRRFSAGAAIRIPLAGSVIKSRVICGAFDSLGALLRGGEQLSTALSIVSETVRFDGYKEFFKRGSDGVARGKSLSAFFQGQRKLFPPYICGVLLVGEKTANMENSVRDISNIAREELEDKLKILTAALEPVLMVTMSFIIGFVALSIILPIYGITTNFQSVQ